MEWLHEITRPLAPGADPVTLGGWMHRRFLFEHRSRSQLMIGATNGHVLTLLPVRRTAVDWLAEPGRVEPPKALSEQVDKHITDTLAHPYTGNMLRTTVEKLHKWAPVAAPRDYDVNSIALQHDPDVGMVHGMAVDRKIVRAATAGLPPTMQFHVWISMEHRMVTFTAPEAVVVVMCLRDNDVTGPAL